MALLTLLLQLTAMATPSVDSLLLDMETRDAFEAHWSSAIVSVIYRPPASPMEDQSMSPPLEVTGFLVDGESEKASWVAAPARRLEGLEAVEVRLASGTTIRGKVEWPGDGRDAPLVRIRLAQHAQQSRHLQWADEERLTVGRRAWVIERPKGRGPTGQAMDPVLVDTSIGPQVEPPLQRFWSARLREADGAPLLDVDGRVLCVIFRSSPVDPTVAYCATSSWAFDVPKRDPQ